MRFLILIAMIAASSAQASTWKDVGTELEWTDQIESVFTKAKSCEKKMNDGATVLLGEQDEAPKVVVFIVTPEGEKAAYADMIGERIALDYCKV